MFTGREATGAKEQRGRRSLPGEPAHAGVAGAPPRARAPLSTTATLSNAAGQAVPSQGACHHLSLSGEKLRPRSPLQVVHPGRWWGQGREPGR